MYTTTDLSLINLAIAKPTSTQQPTEQVIDINVGSILLFNAQNMKSFEIYNLVGDVVMGEELVKEACCECCFIDDSKFVYLTKAGSAIIIAHICEKCITSSEWADSVQPGELHNKV